MAQWPLIGPRLHDFWLMASTDATGLRETCARIKTASVTILGTVAVSASDCDVSSRTSIAGIFWPTAPTARTRPCRSPRLGPGACIAALCTATIAPWPGVIGIAFIQMLLIGIAFVIKGVPGAGLLSLAVLLLGIMQLPATLVTIPVIVYVFATEDIGAANIVFAIYVFIAGLADNVLKPLLLGRGVDVPMPVVLIGALGGMVAGGVIGLFIGPWCWRWAISCSGNGLKMRRSPAPRWTWRRGPIPRRSVMRICRADSDVAARRPMDRAGHGGQRLHHARPRFPDAAAWSGQWHDEAVADASTQQDAPDMRQWWRVFDDPCSMR
jgi:hypothetical protein